MILPSDNQHIHSGVPLYPQWLVGCKPIDNVRWIYRLERHIGDLLSFFPIHLDGRERCVYVDI